ncbi:unnamed protein product [Zymoseptoria tritici ST99CH_3D1]|nr:unnamed protein product [Zymoseptoria tritici ST99CH_3D1]
MHKYSDEEERLLIWLQEHDVASGGLDHRLAESSELRGRVLDLLAQLAGAVSKAPHAEAEIDHNLYTDLDTSSIKLPVSRDILTELRIRDDLSKSSSLSTDTDGTLADSVSDSSRTHVHDVVSRLLELGPSILDPALHDRFDPSAHSRAAQHDISHVRDRFPKAPEDLVSRLGKANWERRQYLVQLRSRLVQVLPEGANPPWQVDDNDRMDAQLDVSDATSEGSDSESSVQSVSHTGELILRPPSTEDATSDLQSSISASGFNTPELQFSRGTDTMTEITAPSKADKPLGKTSSPDMRYGVHHPPHPNKDLSGTAFTCPFCAHDVAGIETATEWRQASDRMGS